MPVHHLCKSTSIPLTGRECTPWAAAEGVLLACGWMSDRLLRAKERNGIRAVHITDTIREHSTAQQCQGEAPAENFGSLDGKRKLKDAKRRVETPKTVPISGK